MILPFRSVRAACKAVPVERNVVQGVLVFLLLFGFAVHIATYWCYRDPSSAFFQPRRAHTPIYSGFRREQAARFIQKATESAPYAKVTDVEPELCIGIASVARGSSKYFEDTVGSLLEGLSGIERARIHLILFIAQTNQSSHPSYGEGWMENVADTLLAYDLPNDTMTDVVQWEKAAGEFRQKALFDYTYLLKACQRVDAPYSIMLEDDVIALDGWFHRTRNALRVADEKTAQIGRNNYLYLRLFFTEQFLGWNSEEWPTYLFCSAAVVILELALVLALRTFVPKTSRFLGNQTLFALCFLCTPLCIALFFAAGRNTVLPLVSASGIVEMPKFGCCSQGLAFPRDRISEVVGMLQEAGVGYVDMLIEEFANRRDEVRWAIVPSVLQHVGSKSSKTGQGTTDSGEFTVAESIWNYAFEMSDPAALREEHVRAIAAQ